MSPVVFRRKTIQSEGTLGEQFTLARTERKLTLGQAEAATSIRQKYLAALEEGRYHDLPEDVYTFGFVQRYAQFLEIPSATLLHAYRTERLAAERLGWARPSLVKNPDLAVVRPLGEPSFIVTPKLFWLLASFLVVFGISGYLWYQVQGFMAAPDLEVLTPAPDMVVAAPSITIEGQTDGSAYVTINAEPIATDPNGTFKQEVHLAEGLNTIEIAARNRLNKETKKQIRVLANYNQ